MDEVIAWCRLGFGVDATDVCLVDTASVAGDAETAGRWLTGDEQAQFASLVHPARRREWLAARIGAKRLLMERSGLADPREIQIGRDERGRPLVILARAASTAAGPHQCSLSHKRRYACACVSSLSQPVGVDIEEVSARLSRMRDAFVQPGDRVGGAADAAIRDTALWAVKEACSKAAGLGLGIGLRELLCRETSPGACEVEGEAGRFYARHLAHGGYIVALAILTEDHCGARAGGGGKAC